MYSKFMLLYINTFNDSLNDDFFQLIDLKFFFKFPNNSSENMKCINSLFVQAFITTFSSKNPT